MKNKLILDACCGSKMMWFEKNHPSVLFADIRSEEHTLCDGRKLVINPDVKMDFRSIPYPDNTFKLVVFDPPHLKRAGKNGWMAKKYGVLSWDWQADIHQGFNECMRVLDTHGILVFKWNETQVKLNDVLECIGVKPLFGHTSGRQAKTIWMTFMKLNNTQPLEKI